MFASRFPDLHTCERLRVWTLLFKNLERGVSRVPLDTMTLYHCVSTH